MVNRDGTARDRRWILVLSGTGVLYWLALLTLVITADPDLFPTVLLLGALVAPATVLAHLNRVDGHGIVGGRTVLWIAAVSGVVGVLPAAILGYATATRWDSWPILTVAVIEEGLKILVPVVVLLATWRSTADPRTGLVVGAAAGAGFAVLETVGQGFTAAVTSGGVASVDQALLIRGVFAPACHLAWTGLLAAAVWRIPSRPVARGVLVLGATYVLVVLLHAARDAFAASWPAQIVVAAVSLLALLIVLQGFAARRAVR